MSLEAEFHSAVVSMTYEQRQWLHGQGVTGRALVDVGLIGVERVRAYGDLYEIDEAGDLVFISPVYDFGDLVDLCAWKPRDPADSKLRRGIAYGFGNEAVATAKWDEEPLAVFGDPLSWLQAGGAGACVVDWDGAWAWFGSITRFLADSNATATKLDRALAPPARHEIRIAQRMAA